MSDGSIRYGLAESPLGLLLIAVTGRGACSVRLGASAAELETGLRGEFPSANVERDDVGLAASTRALAALAQGRTPEHAPALDLRASAFRLRVWDALRAIPRGCTASYGEVARSLGLPRAARAVGQACAANPVALLVPCHRAVPAAGGVGGYRWGPERKRALLRAEAAAAGPCRVPVGAR